MPQALVALSGGADSVALLLHLLELGLDIAAAHCNFHLRGEESLRDERFVRQLCEEQGVRLHVAQFDTAAEAAATGESIEMCARRLRYEWFAKLCQEEGYAAVAVAHHMEDNAETVLLNLVRGTGLHGLCGMATAAPDGVCGKVRVARPLLSWTKSEILAYLEEHHQTYVTDSTNADVHYRRNFIRHRLIPLLQTLNPQVVRSLHETALRLREADAIYKLGLAAADIRKPSALPGGWTVDAEALSDLPYARTLLHEWLSPLGFTAAQAESALTMKPGAILQSQTHTLTLHRHALELAPTPKPLPPTTVPLNAAPLVLPDGTTLTAQLIDREALTAIPSEPNTVALSADALCGPLTVRSLLEADRFQPFGMRGTKLVSDYLTDVHTSRIGKLSALAVVDHSGIAWLVGHRIDARFAVTATTRRVILLTRHLPSLSSPKNSLPL